MPLAALDLLPPFGTLVLLAIIATVALAALLLARWLGPANPVSRHAGLWILRVLILLVLLTVLLNPVYVDLLPGPFRRPEMFYLLDTSASMQMGNPRTRWEDSLNFIQEASEQAGESPISVKPFRFGQRLAAIEDGGQVGLPARVTDIAGAPAEEGSNRKPHAISPADSDTRLLTALRQITSRFGRVPPQGIVLFSDGRAHDETGLEQLAAEFAKLKVPIHVAPVGDMTRGGDVAVSALVVPPRVRKFTEVEVQVFLRSFGYDGKRTEVQLLELVDDDRVGRTLASLPITLQSGFQSVSLSFRTDLSTRKLRVAVPAAADEISLHNNQIGTELAVDRTKIRVLYIEGSSQPYTSVRVADRFQLQGPFTDLKQALVEDEDIECVVLARQGGLGNLVRMSDQGQDGVRGFPTTVAELSAFDAIVLSNVSRDAFTEKQLEWIEQWIGQRGGGICMLGGENSFAAGGWAETPLLDMLPVEMLSGGYDWVPGEQLQVKPQLAAAPHPLWTLLADAKANEKVVTEFPQVTGFNRWGGPRSNLATVLATTNVSGMPSAATRPAPNVIGDFLQGLVATQPYRPAGGQVETGPSVEMPAIVAGRYGKGRTIAIAFPFTAPYAAEFSQRWGQGDNRYYGKFCRNLVYWLTENSAIGRRRLVATASKRFYRPGETISLSAATYDESAAPTKSYRVVAMVEPQTAPGDVEPETSPLKWPAELTRESGEEGPYIAWGEEFPLPLGGQDKPLHSIDLPLAEVLASGTASQSLRVELTAYEDFTQVDSTSLDLQVLHDPFEQQNPFPNHDLLRRIAASSGGKVLASPTELAEILTAVDADVGPPVVKRSPLWSNGWVLLLLLGLLTGEWCWRRRLGLA